MIDRGLDVEFSAEALDQLHSIRGPSVADGEIEDLRSLLWCSIDNDDSEDLDQLTVAENLGNGAVRILVAVADVDALVAKAKPIDRHASQNTVSVYVAGHVYPMLPERLSTDLTSLNPDVDRVGLALIANHPSPGKWRSGNRNSDQLVHGWRQRYQDHAVDR